MTKVTKIDPARSRAEEGVKSLRILLAEDTPIAAEAMKAMGRHFSVEMDHAINGLEAIEMIDFAHGEGKPYTLVLADVMMPVLGGVEMTRRLRDRGYSSDTLPIIAVTAATSLDETREYFSAGMQAFLTKPVSLEDLRAALMAWGHRGKAREKVLRKDIFRDLRRQFTERNEHTLRSVEAALGTDDPATADIDEIRNLLHQIAGTAATLGDPELSVSARKLETNLVHHATTKEALRKVLEETAIVLKDRIAA